MMRRLPFVLPLLLAACDLAPHYVRPGMAAPARLPQGGPYAPAPDAAPDVAAIGWRAFFTDDRLARTIALALANNRDLRIAAGNILQARAQYRAQRADLFPTLAANGAATVRHTGSGATVASTGATTGSGTGTTTGTGIGTGTGNATTSFGGSGTVDSYSATLGVSAWEIDLFGRIRNLTRGAQEAYFATREARDATQISLISETATAWLTMASDQDQLALSRDTFRSFSESYAIVKAQADKGIASDLDVAQADTNLQTARDDVARLTAQVSQDQNALNLLAGATVPADLLPDSLGARDVTLAALPAGLDSTVLLKRPDVLQAEDQLKAENANIGAARAAFFPTISLTAAAGTAAGALGGLFAGGSWTWSASGTASQTIFDFGRNRANLRYAEASREVALATYDRAVQTAFREVADALAVRGTIEERLAAQGRRVGSARTAADLSLRRYTAGIDPYLTTLDSQRTLYTAQQTLVTTRLQRAANLVTLYTALGGGLA